MSPHIFLCFLSRRAHDNNIHTIHSPSCVYVRPKVHFIPRPCMRTWDFEGGMVKTCASSQEINSAIINPDALERERSRGGPALAR